MTKIKLLFASLVALALLATPGAAMAKSKDRDHDKMPDRWERAHGLKVGVRDANRDPDHDGLVNLAEFRAKTDPQDVDTDNDHVSDANEDPDHDGVDNRNEAREHTDPRRADTDRDHVRDGREDADHDGLRNAAEDQTGNDPIDPDSDNDGVKDGKESAGSIVSFSDGVLTIGLASGGTVSARVTADTEVSCETEREHEDENEADDHGRDHAVEARAASDGSGDESSDDNDDQEEAELEQEDQGDEDNVCSASDLAAGVKVHEAKLEQTADGAVFSKVEILK